MILFKVMIGLTLILLLLILLVFVNDKTSDKFNQIKSSKAYKTIVNVLNYILLILFFGVIIACSYAIGDTLLYLIKG